MWKTRCEDIHIEREKLEDECDTYEERQKVQDQRIEIILGLKTHEKRRQRGDLINMFKHLSDESLFTLRNEPRFRGNSKTLKIPVSNCLIKKQSFSARSVSYWNMLPEDVVNSQSLNIFKNKLDKYMNHQYSA